MKKLPVFIILGIVFALFSCDDYEKQVPGKVTVKNSSAVFDVTYKIGNGTENIIAEKKINHGQNEDFVFPLYSYIVSYENSKRVLIKTEFPSQNDIKYTFADRKSYQIELKIELALASGNSGKDITISADGWMDQITIDKSHLSPGTVWTGTDPAWLIYTDKPAFSAAFTDKKKATVTHQFVAGDICVVTIKG